MRVFLTEIFLSDICNSVAHQEQRLSNLKNHVLEKWKPSELMSLNTTFGLIQTILYNCAKYTCRLTFQPKKPTKTAYFIK